MLFYLLQEVLYRAVVMAKDCRASAVVQGSLLSAVAESWPSVKGLAPRKDSLFGWIP